MGYGQADARGITGSRDKGALSIYRQVKRDLARDGFVNPASVTVTGDAMVTGIQDAACPLCGQALIAANHDEDGFVQCAECGEWVAPEGS